MNQFRNVKTPVLIHSMVWICFLAAGLSTVSAQDSTAQDSSYNIIERKNDTTEISWQDKKFVIVKDDEGTRVSVRDHDSYVRRYRRRRPFVDVKGLGFDFGVTNYHDDGVFGKDAAPGELELRAFRPGGHVALHILPTTFGLFGRGLVNIKTALTIDYNNYYFVRDISLLPDQDSLTIVDAGENLDRNKLFASYVQVPLFLNFDTRPGSSSRGFSLSVGGYVGWLWNSRTKQVNGNDKDKVKDRYSLNNFRYGLSARLRIRWIRLYFNYNLSPMFEEGRGPSMNTFTTGINIFTL